MKKVTLGLILSFGFSGTAFANVEVEARNVLIEKFQRVYQNLPPESPARVGVTLRLADLLAERARQSSMAELDAGCVTCTVGLKDRKTAIKYYNEVLDKIDSSQKGKILAQLGHLYQLTDEVDKAITLYRSIIDGEKNSEYLSEAEISLAEIYFKRRDYAQAKDYYDLVYGRTDSKRRSMAAYRRAWCLFNLGQVEKATEGLLEILNTPKLLTRNSSTVIAVDEQYKSEVVRDLATFMAKNKAGIEEAKLLHHHSPEKEKLSHVTYLAAELERLGEAREAITIFRYVVGKESDPRKRMGIHLRIMQMEKDLGQYDVAVDDFKKALDLWQQTQPCDIAQCDEWKTRMRKFVLDWHRAEKKKPSSQLLLAYGVYIETFTNEVDMRLWRAEASKQEKRFKETLADYDRVIELTLSGKAIKGKNNKDELPDLESLLLTEIELAEQIGDSILLKTIYNKYLGLSQKKTKELEVRYQIAHLDYEAKQYSAAAEQFREVALSKSAKDLALQAKAADLALDALVLLKDEARLEKWSTELAQSFPDKGGEYLSVARKSVINQSAALAGSDQLGAWKKLAEFNLSGASEQEQITYYRNRLILAEKLQKFADAKEAANKLLGFKSLPAEDRRFALSRKAWLAELFLDFKTALNVMAKLETPELESDQRSLKLAMFAELAGQSSKTYYKDYLRQTKDEDRRYSTALRLVEKSKDPLLTLRQYRKILATKPNQYAKLYLEYFCQENCKIDDKFSKLFLADKVLKSTPTALFVWRQSQLDKIEHATEKLREHQLKSKTQRQLSRSMAKRVKLIDRLEGLLGESIKREDWSTQVLAIHNLAIEAERFYQDILSLPMPEGLSDADQMQYMQLLSQQASPYKMRADELVSKEAEFWQNPEIVEKFKVQYQALTEQVRPLLAKEIQLVSGVAKEEVKQQLLAVLDYKDPQPIIPSLAEIEKARQSVRQQPMDVQRLENLYNLESQMGSSAMSAYLQGRISQLKEKGQAQESEGEKL